MGSKTSTTIDKALTSARKSANTALAKEPKSRYLPLLIATLESLLVSLSQEMMQTQVLHVSLGVTRIYARTLDGKVLPLWDEHTWLPFATFSNLVSQRSCEFAWRTSNWVITDDDLTPLLGSLSASLWLLDMEAGLPYCVTQGGVIGNCSS